MKKMARFSSIMAAILVVSSMAIPAYAASDPADDVSTYSYNEGKKAYEALQAEGHPWFDNEDEATTANYSFHAGNQAAVSRNNIFAGMPTGDDVTEEEMQAFFESNGLGEGAAYENGEYNEDLKSSYGYMTGKAAFEARQATFSETTE
ncbi:MAG: hypothetical protein K5989_05430 [Lachnospiraceae bacterium]|nr:hypothetical protein [Lachnospiraceae bacterium]